jgi:hypothetical protein
MKNFSEWIKEEHPEFQIDEVHPWLKTAALLGASAAAGIGGEEARKAAYEPHNSIIPSVRTAAYDRYDAERTREMEAEKYPSKRPETIPNLPSKLIRGKLNKGSLGFDQGLHDILQNAIKKHKSGQKLSPEESHVLNSSDYDVNSADDETLAKNSSYPSQFDIAKQQGKTLVYPTKGERLYGQTQNFPDVNAAPLDQQDPVIKAYYAKYPHRLK